MPRTQNPPGGRSAAAAAQSSSTAGASFGMAHAVVIVAFLAAAVVLALVARMELRDILFLLAGVGAIAASVLVSAHFMNRRVGAGLGLLRRVISAVVQHPPAGGGS
ncbi:hypothetical protein [Streptomyces sp. NPDC004230]